MANNNINSYIRQLLDQGYSLNTIRTQLKNAKYNEKEIDSAINYVYSHPYTIKKKGKLQGKLPSKKIMIGVGAAAAIAIVVFAIFMLVPGASSKWLKMGVSSQMNDVGQGEDFSFTVDLSNTGKKRSYSIFLSHEITNLNTGSLLTIKTETVQLETSASHISTVKIPADSKPGSYSVTTTAVFLDQKVTEILSFDINRKAIVPTCADNIQNQGETGVDCGGPCTPCEDGQASTIPTPGTGPGVGGLTPGTPAQPTVLPQDAASFDHDGDGIPNVDDSDDDNDGILDSEDDYPFDFDNDGISDLDDEDDDNDGILDSEDNYPYDFDNDGITNRPGPPVQLSTELGGTAAQCPASCNDYDICTTDTCVNGLCQHLRKSPCCGDFICEDEESALSCPQDCATQQAPKTRTAAEIIQEAVEDAATDPEAAALVCYSLSLESDADECFFRVADEANVTTICDQIRDDRKRDSCYMNKLLENNDLIVCNKINNQIVQRTCFSLVNIRAQEQAFIEQTGMAPSLPEGESVNPVNLPPLSI